ncbi:hypothetical protein [Aliiglaciecola sp. LCG003]|uniref:hypothetical protein n=1 Tax=Aliiglaciecola sp. LCG003 TaxID=3053655 RepID=UPI0025726498|nr:hypothetical protein [Aliiglaciecola sp. LCG003]WJG07621.1 hypothetical protein QR722_09585 [Aliiglaciecola sp. LCG003]
MQLTFEAVTTESLWKAGATGKFSYAGVGASVGVSGSYGHTELSEEQIHSGRVDRISNGKCVEQLVDKWEAKLTDILTNKVDTIGKTSVGDLGSAPIPSLPDAPERIKPKAQKGVVDKIDAVKDMEGLKAFAKAQAYDAYVKSCKQNGATPSSLDQFLEEASQPNDLTGLDQEVDPLDYDTVVNQTNVTGLTARAEEVAQAKELNQSSADFVAVGAWLVPWGQIFPWLADIQINTIPKGEFSSSLYTLRMLASDIATLADTYRHLEVKGVKIKALDLDPGPIANAFQSLHARAQALLNEQLSEPGGKYSPDTLKTLMKDIIGKLATKYRKIYSTWANTPHLRKCELGAGVTITHKGIDLLPSTLDSGDLNNWYVNADDSSFDPMVLNYEAFASSIKATPVIIPSGQIVMFVAWQSDTSIPAAGILCADTSLQKSNVGCYVSNKYVAGTQKDNSGATQRGHAMTFKPNGIVLTGNTSKALFVLHPIPFSAARNVEWLGAGSSVGISDMKANIQAMRYRLAGLKRWSFGNEYWAERDPDEPLLSLQKLEPFYIGLVEEPSLFKSSKG